MRGRPYPEVTVAFLPSSLGNSHSFALVYSTYPPVSVFGTDSLFFPPCGGSRSFSWKAALSNSSRPKPEHFINAWNRHLKLPADLPADIPNANNANPIMRSTYWPPSLHRKNKKVTEY